MTGNVRELKRVETRSDMRGRINLALSLLSHRRFCEHCDPSLDLVRGALAGSSIDELRTREAASDDVVQGG